MAKVVKMTETMIGLILIEWGIKLWDAELESTFSKIDSFPSLD